MLRRLLPLLGIATVLTGTAGSAQAVAVLDQSSLGPSDQFASSATIAPVNPLAQTFTVGIAGELSSVAFALMDHEESGTLIAEIRTTAAGAPTATVLASVPVDSSEVPDSIPIPPLPIGADDLITIDLSLFDIAVSVGDVLAIVLSPLNPYHAHAFFTSSYAGGSAYSGGPSGFESFGDIDLPFQTFVEPRAVPEPGSLALVLAGVAGIGLAARRRTNR